MGTIKLNFCEDNYDPRPTECINDSYAYVIDPKSSKCYKFEQAGKLNTVAEGMDVGDNVGDTGVELTFNTDE